MKTDEPVGQGGNVEGQDLSCRTAPSTIAGHSKSWMNNSM